VQRLLADKPPVNVGLHAPPAVQRKPYGLESSGSISTYTDAAAKLWKTQPKMTLKDFTSSMMNIILQEFKTHNVPLCKVTIKSGLGFDGKFEQKPWEILINPDNFSATPGAKVLDDLDKDEVESVVGTFYHEARHADQDFLVARMLAGKGKKASEINAKTQIPVWVADEAVKQKLTKTSPDIDQLPHAEVLFDTMYGEHKELLAFIIDLSDTLQTVKNEALAVDAKSLSSVVTKSGSLVKKLEAWSTSTLKKKLENLGKKKNKSALDQQMFDDLTKIDKQLQIVIPAWKKLSKPTVADIQGFGKQLDGLFTVVFEAYKKLESEADAFRVEDMVKGEFKKKT